MEAKEPPYEDFSRHPSVMHSKGMYVGHLANLMQTHLEEERVKYREYLKGIENTLLNVEEGSPEEVAQKMRDLKGRILRAEAELRRLKDEGESATNRIDEMRRQQALMDAETKQYEAEARRLEAVIKSMQPRSDNLANDQPPTQT